MFNDPEWASEAEWDAYAWFGFAMSEAQMIEGHLLVAATAIGIVKKTNSQFTPSWPDLLEKYGNGTMGQLLNQIHEQRPFPPDL